MIFDSIKNAGIYENFDERLKKGFDFILNNDLKVFDNGKYEIDGTKIFANIQEYTTKESGLFESHKKYIDIQYIIKGFEQIEVNNIENLEQCIEYDEEKDVMFFNGAGSFIKIKEGYFTIFYPQDGHKPCISDINKSQVKKVVVKILI